MPSGSESEHSSTSSNNSASEGEARTGKQRAALTEPYPGTALDTTATTEHTEKNDERKSASYPPESVAVFVGKIVATVVRQRSALNSTATPETHFLARGHGFWTASVPIHVDVAVASLLVERWVLAFEPSDSSEDVSVAEIVLLAQSLYSYLRLMPMHPLVQTAQDQLVCSISTPEVSILHSQFSSSQRHHLSDPVSFSPTAKLRAYRFRSARSSAGTLHLSVIYDASITSASLATFLRQSSFASSITSNTPSDTSESLLASTSLASSPVSRIPISNTTSYHPTASNTDENLTSLGVAIPTRRSTADASFSVMRLDENGMEVDDEVSLASPFQETPPPFDKSAFSSSDPQLAVHTQPIQTQLSASALSRQLSDLSINTTISLPSNQQPPPSTADSPDSFSSSPMSPVELDTPKVISQSASATRFSTTPPPHRAFSTPFPSSSSVRSSGERPLPQFHQSLHLAPLDPLSGSLVGSYEESILNGRMSCLPSKPLPFVCELGVVAVGKCKNPALQAPKPLRLAFDACFYEFGGGAANFGQGSSGTGSVGVGGFVGVSPAASGTTGLFGSSVGSTIGLDDGVISPYVGNVDVEGLGGLIWDINDFDGEMEVRKNWIGGYRVPAKGQLQIIIKNAADTAVKVYLIPYDLRDMPPNSKTFLRQKTYMISKPPSANPTPVTSISRRGSVTSPTVHPPKDRLRDAIHIHFQCSSRKRIYITRTMRVVFAHKALESDEKWRSVIETPGEDRYTPMSTTTPAQSSLEKPSTEDDIEYEEAANGSGDRVGAGMGLRLSSLLVRKRSSQILQQQKQEEVLSVSPSRRSFLAGGAASPISGVSLSGGSVLFPSSASGVPRRSSLGKTMLALAGVSLEDGRVRPRHVAAFSQGVLGMPTSFGRAESGNTGNTLSFDKAWHPASLPSTSAARPAWMVPPPNQSSLSIALSMSSTSGSAVSSAATTPKIRSRCSSTEVLSGGGSGLRSEVERRFDQDSTDEEDVVETHDSAKGVGWERNGFR
ncbi:hypothetical protein BC830DRAFT_1143695 [Chytriomyces sp. MP71]|nr:hypothetical protein BC830DRAFT_1143695 [Chytriomyces sp. MP71]